MTKIIAHRGDTSNYPENTLSAFQTALAGGATAIELDVHLTSDGELVVHHDYYLGNPDDGEGTLPDQPLSYIKGLKIGSSEHIPTLEEVFETLGSKLQYEIELKGFTEEFIQKVIQLVTQYGLTNNIEFTSPHPYVLTRLKAIDPSLKTGTFVAPLPGWMDVNLGQTLAIHNRILGQVDVLHCPIDMITEDFVQRAHTSNLFVHAADCDTEEHLDHARKAGVDQLSTNNLKLALSKFA